MKEFEVYKSAKSNPDHGGLGGIGIENFNDIKEEDTIECFEMQEVER